jgi:hypothetical protein
MVIDDVDGSLVHVPVPLLAILDDGEMLPPTPQLTSSATSSSTGPPQFFHDFTSSAASSSTGAQGMAAPLPSPRPRKRGRSQGSQ